MGEPLEILENLLGVGLSATDPYDKIFKNLPDRPKGRLFILSIGKAASRMAEAAADFYVDGYEGYVFAPEGYGRRIKWLRTFEGTHPVPSAKNVEITERIMNDVSTLGEGDMLLALISGGTSALLCAPDGVTLKEKISETKKLLKSGVPIREVNDRRREMSAVKGGKLGELARPGKVVTLMVSDVTGDDPRVIGSAPTGGGRIVLNADYMLDAIRLEAELKKISVANLGQASGPARDLAGVHAALAQDYSGTRPHLILSGGETDVKVTGTGQGGRNTEYALALAIALEGARGIYGLAIDTDGHDGTGPFAGALFSEDTLEAANMKGINPGKLLKNNDSGSFFKATGGLITPGPTLSNLNDLRMILLV